MPEHYNISFLIAAFVLIVLVLFHFVVASRHDDSQVSRLFLVIVGVGAADVALDMALSLMLANPAAYPLPLLYTVSTAFYLLQCTIPFILFLFAVIACKGLARENAAPIVLMCVPCAAFVLLVLGNPATHLVFWFDEAGHTYLHGPLYMGMFLYALFYGIVAALYATAHRAVLRRMDLLAVWEFFAIVAVCVSLQYLLQDVLLTGFGIGLGVLVLFLTISNPFELIDPLTGVFEATRFKRRVSTLIGKKRPYGVVFVSLDYLKRLNLIVSPDFADDTVLLSTHGIVDASYGEPVYRLRKSLFAIIVHSRHQRQRIVTALEAFFAQEHLLRDTPLELDASVGYVSKEAEFTSADEMQAYIDYLIDIMQQKGALPSTSDRQGLIAAFRRMEDVRRCVDDAIRNDLFEVYLQPLYSLKEQRFVSAEALSRLHHPEIGAVPPSEFMAVAEEEGRITEIGRLQFRKICRFAEAHLGRLREVGIESIKVNVSPVELMDPGLGDFLLATMEQSGLEPSFFQFEITETIATQHTEDLMRFTDKLLAAGSVLCMDDFGSGFANFNVVVGLPFEIIKVDASLLADAVKDERSGILYRGILSMMTELGFNVVCEGVETEGQAGMLRSWGADIVQGYRFARPMPLAQVLELEGAAHA